MWENAVCLPTKASLAEPSDLQASCCYALLRLAFSQAKLFLWLRNTPWAEVFLDIVVKSVGMERLPTLESAG